ncbi:MAG: hypothetical protein ABIO72_03820 [Patescibacteria group bacterium]
MKKFTSLFGSLVYVASLTACQGSIEIVDRLGESAVEDLSSEDGDGGSGSVTSATTTTSVASTAATTSTSTSSASSSGSSGTGGSVPAAVIFSLASNPVSGIVSKKAQGVPVVGITITAGDQDVTIPFLTLTTQAEIAGSGCSFGEPCAYESASMRIISLSLWDGATQLGGAKAPELTTGKAMITGVNTVVSANTTKTIIVKASFSSSASDVAPYDHVAVGIENASDVIVLDEQQQPVLGSLDTVLQDQLSAMPSVEQEIRNSGVLSIESYATPLAKIVIAGGNVWIPFAQFRATALYEAASIDRLSVSMLSVYSYDPADVTEVAVATAGSVKGTAVMPPSGHVDVDLSQNHLDIPEDGVRIFQLWAKLAPVVSRNVNPASSGLARSGHSFGLTLSEGTTTGEWDPAYGGSLNVRTTGTTSGERLYASSLSDTSVFPMVVRKTKPTVTKLNLSSTTLANIDMDLIKFQVAADVAGSVGIKQIMFNVAKSPGVTLSNFRVRRGATDMALSDIAVTFQNGSDLESGSLVVSSGVIVVSFTNAETIAGSGNVYTLHANVSGAVSGKNVTIAFYRDPSESVITGTLMSNVSYGPYANSPSIFQLDDILSQGGTADAIGTFLWRDGSELVGVEADWAPDFLVEDLEQSQTTSG